MSAEKTTEGVPGWVCGVCTYCNHFDFPSCAMCSIEQPADPEIGTHIPDASIQPFQTSIPSTRDFFIEETRPMWEVRRAERQQTLYEYVASTLNMLKFEHNQIILAYTLSWDLLIATAATTSTGTTAAAGTLRAFGSAELYKCRLPISNVAFLCPLMDRRLLAVVPVANATTIGTATAAATASAAIASASTTPSDAKSNTRSVSTVAAASSVESNTGHALIVTGPWSFDFVATEPDALPATGGDAAAATATAGKDMKSAPSASLGSSVRTTNSTPAGGVVPVSALASAPKKEGGAVHAGFGVGAVALLGDGRFASAIAPVAGVTGEAAASVHVWDKTADRVMLRLEGGHAGPISALIGLADGRIVTAGGGGGGVADGPTIRVWTLSKGEYKASASPLVGHAVGSIVTSLVSWGDNRFASGGSDGAIRLYDKYGKNTHSFAAHKGAVTCLVVTSDGWLVSAGTDCVIRFWERTRCIVTTSSGAGSGHTTPISALITLPDGRIASGSMDGSVCVWTTTGQLKLTIAGPNTAAAVTSLACVDDW